MLDIFRLCKKYLALEYKRVVITSLLSFVVSLLIIIQPYIMGSFIDDVLIKKDAKELSVFCAIFLLSSLLIIIFSYIANIVSIKVTTNAGYYLNRELICHMQDAESCKVDSYDSAYLTQRVNNDSNQIVIYCLETIKEIPTNIVTIVACAIYIFTINYIFFLIGIGSAIIYIIAYVTMKRKLYILGYNFKEFQSIFFSKLNEQFRMNSLIKAKSIADVALTRLDSAFNNLFSKILPFQRISYLFGSLDNLISVLIETCIFVVGGLLVFYNTISIGEFTILNTYTIMLQTSVKYFFELGKNTQETKISAERVRDINKIQKEKDGFLILDNINSIEIKNLSLCYDKKIICKKITKSFRSKGIYGIIGENGAGKTTFIKTIIGIHHRYTGNIFINGINIKNINMFKARGELVAFCEQDTLLFQDTAMFNVTFGKFFNDNVITHFARMFGIEGILDDDEPLAENGSNLSGGEQKKLSLARELIIKSDLLILDEPTLNLDKTSKMELMEHLKKLSREKIIMLVTHDQDIMKYMDDIVNLGGANVKE